MRGETAQTTEIDVPAPDPRIAPSPIPQDDLEPPLVSAFELGWQIAGALIVLALLLSR